MRHGGDDVLEVLHDHAPTVCVGRYPFAYINAFKSHVNLYSFEGALTDTRWDRIGDKRKKELQLEIGR